MCFSRVKMFALLFSRFRTRSQQQRDSTASASASTSATESSTAVPSSSTSSSSRRQRQRDAARSSSSSSSRNRRRDPSSSAADRAGGYWTSSSSAAKKGLHKRVKALKAGNRGLPKQSNRRVLQHRPRPSSLSNVSTASDLSDDNNASSLLSDPLMDSEIADNTQLDTIDLDENENSSPAKSCTGETSGSSVSKTARDDEHEFDLDFISNEDMADLIDALADSSNGDISYLSEPKRVREGNEDQDEFSTSVDDQNQEEMDEAIARLTLSTGKDLRDFTGVDEVKEEYDGKKEEKLRAGWKAAALEKIRKNRKEQQLSDRQKMEIIMVALYGASSKIIVGCDTAEAIAGPNEEEATAEENTLIGDDLDRAASKLHIGHHQATADDCKETEKPPLELAWIPVSRFNLAHPTPVTIKPAKPLFTPFNPMSAQETNIYRTDLLTALRTQQQELSKMRSDRCEHIRKEVAAVVEALDLVSARQEYLSLLVQMFKDEPHKLTQEFREYIEFRLVQHNKEEADIMVRFAKLEVEWEKVRAMDEENAENEAATATAAAVSASAAVDETSTEV